MDPQQQHAASAIAGLMGIFLLIALAFLVFGIFLFWRILTKAGLAGPLSLIILVPGIGYIVVLCILAFSEWKVTPIAETPYYPPPSTYPPAPAIYPPPPPPAM